MNIYENFPKKLKESPQWVMWKYIPVEGQEKPTKILFSPKSGKTASSINSETWSSFETCIKELDKKNGGYAGVGFVFTQNIVAIDLDNCFKNNGTLKDWAQAAITRFPSYIEKSPSKKGLHIILEGEIDLNGRKKDWIEDGEKVGIECYTKSRYFTVTGDVYNGFTELKSFPEDVIFEWYHSIFGSKEKLLIQVPESITDLPSDEKILEVMRRARNGSKFIALFDHGDWKSWGFPSQSEADMSLVGSLMFFCCNDRTTVERLFRQSKLVRKKWARQDYRDEMIKKCYHTSTMDWKKPEESDEPEDELVIRSLAGVKPTNVRWIWHSRLAKGKLTLFQGYPGQGKSQISIYIAAIISKGAEFVDDNSCEQGQVLFISAEDDASDTLKPRLMAQNANMDNIFELQWIKTTSGKTVLFNFDKYMDELKKAARTLKDLKLIVVDPISAFLGRVDGNASGEVRGLLHELKSVAEEHDCAVVLITHNNKTTGQAAISRSSGSHAFGAAARMVYAFGTNPLKEGETTPEKTEFAMAPIKNNLTKDPDTLLYTIESTIVDGENGEDIVTSYTKWCGTTDATAQEIVDYNPNKKSNKNSGRGRPTKIFDECVQLLKQLTGNREKVGVEDVKEVRKELMSWDYTDQMINKARTAIGYKVICDGVNVIWTKTQLLDDF